MKITTEDKALLDKLQILAETKKDELVAVVFRKPAVIAISTSYRSIYKTFKAVIERDRAGTGSNEPERQMLNYQKKIIQHLRDKHKETSGPFFNSCDAVAVGFSGDDILEAYRLILTSGSGVIELGSIEECYLPDTNNS
ncbi:hypothetical protein BS822_08435 [Salmonella enterica]|nr:hypothetical protein [Salmonella enterica]EAQ6662110.1 hypothetical protein [Salmonella enterica]EAX9513745.1 hypothetical protein [Salmonella enterica]